MGSETYKHIELESSDNILKVKLNRPDKHNALNIPILQELTRVFSKLENPGPPYRMVLIEGNGKSFCSGADLKVLSVFNDKAASEEFAKTLFDCIDSVLDTKLPVVAKVHGSVYGGALGLIAACDMVFCETRTKFCFSEVRLGLVPAIISPFVVKKIGRNNALKYMISATVFDSTEAINIGLVTNKFDMSELDDEINKIAGLIASNEPEAVKKCKQLINEVSNIDDVKFYKEMLINEFINIAASEKAQKGISTFLGKRTPEWEKPEQL